MSLASYLVPRGKRGIVQLRVPVPRALHAPGKPKERIRSLGTSDRVIAAKLAVPILADWQAEWAGARGLASPPTPRRHQSIGEAALDIHDELLARLETQRRTRPSDDATQDAEIEKRKADLKRLTRRALDGDLSHWEAMASRLIDKGGMPIERDSDAFKELAEALAVASVEAVSAFARRHEGELDAASRHPLIVEQRKRQNGKAKPGQTISELFELWAAEMLAKAEKRPDTVNQDRKVIAQFAAFVGVDRAIDSITPVEIAKYRQALLHVPPKWRTHKALAGMDMRRAAIEARKLDLPCTAYTSVNKHLSTISPLYKWLARDPNWAGLQNPCNGLFHHKVKGKNPRPPFTTAVLNKILTSPLFTGFRADGAEHEPGEATADDWRKWIPLICLFTGARLGEIAQLRVGDIRQDRGVWFIHIRHDESAGLTTKSGKSRPAAVHSTLQKLGLIEWHERQLKRASRDADAPLFPELEPDSRGHISGTPSRWWRDYLTAIGVKGDRDGLGAHSFRHTLADRLRGEAELLDDQVAVCLGHNQKTTTSGYGELPQGTVTMFKSWMDAVRFDGVEFGHLMPASNPKQ